MFVSGSHAELSSSIEAIGASFAIYQKDEALTGFKLVSNNSLYEEITGLSPGSCVGKLTSEIFPRYIEKILKEKLQTCLKEQASIEAEVVIEREGKSRWWRFIFSPVLPIHHNYNRVINTCVEITDRKLLEKKLELTRQRFEAVVEAAYDGIISIDHDQKHSVN